MLATSCYTQLDTCADFISPFAQARKHTNGAQIHTHTHRNTRTCCACTGLRKSCSSMAFDSAASPLSAGTTCMQAAVCEMQRMKASV